MLTRYLIEMKAKRSPRYAATNFYYICYSYFGANYIARGKRSHKFLAKGVFGFTQQVVAGLK